MRAEVEAWLAEAFDPGITVGEWWRRLAEAGFAHPTWPVGAGGRAATAAEAKEITAALAGHGVVAPPVGAVAATLAAPTLLAHGSAEQISTLVRDIAHGTAAWCQLFSEPSSGSDLASATTRAEPDGDEFVVTGQKVWSSAADLADLGMLLARTDPSAPKHRGLTYFAIDMDQPGIEVRPLRVMNGTAPFCEVFLDGARVHRDRVVGEIGGGWDVARTTLAAERRSVAGGGVPGLVPARSGTRGDLHRTVAEVLDRAAGGAATARPGRLRSGAVPVAVMLDLARAHGVADDPVVRQDLARYHSQVKVDGWSMRRMAAAGGRLTGADSSMAKLATARICQVSRDLSCGVVGAPLLLTGPDSPLGGDLQAVNLASPGTRIGGGTDEIQRTVLGEQALGLPREPRAPGES